MRSKSPRSEAPVSALRATIAQVDGREPHSLFSNLFINSPTHSHELAWVWLMWIRVLLVRACDSATRFALQQWEWLREMGKVNGSRERSPPCAYRWVAGLRPGR